MTIPSEHWPRVKAVFNGAVALEGAARATYVAEACGDDVTVRRHVDRLLASHDQAQSFLEDPATDVLQVPPPVDDITGRIIETYRVESRLGSGGMGEVYKAYDAKLDRPVALKLLSPQYATDAERLRRFHAEGRAASSLNHPHILVIHDFGEYGGRPFMVTEFVEGQTLRQRLEAGPLGVREAAEIAIQVTSALAAAHARGIVHRDIKPENVMVRPDGYVKVLDFGIAKLLPADSAEAASVLMTNPGTVMGTPRYMSPEQARGRDLDARSDVWSLGAMLYEMVTGHAAFEGPTTADVMAAILGHEPPPLASAAPGIPASLDRIVRKTLRKDREARYETASALHAELLTLRLELDVTTHRDQPPAETALPADLTSHTVGRERERTALRAALESAAAGHGVLIAVAGEPGIGKTTLVEEFLAESQARPLGRETREPAPYVARGRCSERLAGSDAYLPVLEALDSLMNDTRDDPVAQLMRSMAPTWFVQLAPLGSAGVDPELAAQAKTGSQERLKRELTAFFQHLSRTRPLIVSFDDVHWADVSTIDLLAYLSGKLASLRVLVITTHRPTDLLLARHPFLQLKRDLQSRGLCKEISLDFLDRTDITQYLALEFPGHRFPIELPALIHEKTEGSPLFMADVVRYLRASGVLTTGASGQWTLQGSLSEVGRDLPESVRGMIERKIAQLPDDDRALLTAASVQGYEFDSTIVAHALSLGPGLVEEQLEVLERVHRFVRLVDEREFPDRSLTLRYRFVHALYQNALYGQLRATRRTTLSAAIATAMLRAHAPRDHEVASELAVLLEAARDFGRAAEYCRIAAERAATLFASQEAVVLARRGLTLLEALPDGRDRTEHELTLRLVLGNALIATRGYAADEVEATYSRARELCQQLGETLHLPAVLYGFSAFYLVRGNHPMSLQSGEELLALTARLAHPAIVVGHRLCGWPLLAMGELLRAREHFDAAGALYDAPTHRPLAFTHGQEPGLSARVCLGMTLVLLGYPDQARQRCREALDLARLMSSHGNSQGYAYHFSAICAQFLGDAGAARERTEAELVLAEEQGLGLWKGWGAILHGWAVVETLGVDAAIAEIRRGIGTAASLGAGLFHTYHLALLADVLLKAGRASEGLEVIDEAFAFLADSEERFWEAEILRLQGELLLTGGASDEQAEERFRRSIGIAKRQSGKSLELRAAMSLARLLQKRGDNAPARELLGEIYDWFTEGFDTADLKDARALIDRLDCAAPRR